MSRKLYKRCRCDGSSSGPRLVTRRMDGRDGHAILDCRYVAMACDVCDKPWVRALGSKKKSKPVPGDSEVPR